MFENIENLKLLSSHLGVSNDYTKIENRKKHSFLFRTKGAGFYTVDNKKIYINEGEMSFLPKGSSYEFTRTSECKCEYLSISFEADIDDARVVVYPMDNFAEKSYIINHYMNLWKFGGTSEHYKCYSFFYSIISHLTNIENSDYVLKKKLQIIEPAVEYLKNHIYDTELKTDNLHKISGVSDTYFRKIFISRFGLTPKEYIISQRISHAKDLIDSGNTISISELSLSVGYADPLYFSRAFKKKYGVPPTMI